jgi:hypothetical protein
MDRGRDTGGKILSLPRRNREPFWISNFGLTKRRSVSVLIVEVTKAAKPRGIFGLL